MRLGFAFKLFLIPAVAALGFLLAIVVSMTTSRRLHEHIDAIEARYVPLIELGPRLTADLERMREGLQGAVAAQDPDELGRVQEVANELLASLDEGRGVVEPADLASARAAVTAYFDVGSSVSRRIIEGETGEGIVDAMRGLQVAHDRAAAALERATAVDRRALRASFESLREAGAVSRRLSLGIGVGCMTVVLLLALAVGRGVTRSLAELTAGFARFGEGQFERPMGVLSDDELGDAAGSANEMAAKLLHAQVQRRAAEWVRTGNAGLALELTGDHAPSETARRLTVFVARHVGALAGALYTTADDGALVCAASYARSGGEPGPARRVAPGEGLLGEAALGDTIVEVQVGQGAPALQVVQTGLGEIRPRALVLVPITDRGAAIAVLELALGQPLDDDGREFLTASRRTIAIGLTVARSQAARRDLLTKTQLQASRLAEQEEHLTQTNAALEGRQVELQRAVAELRQQTAELDSFTYSVSHDLRAPLRAIDGFSRILVEDHGDALDAEGQRVAGVIRANTQKMGQLIDDLLAFSRLGRQAVKLASVDMAALAREAFRESAAAEPRRSIELVMPDHLPLATGDASLLRQVWSNLLANGVKYTRPRPHAVIQVSAVVDEDYARYSVRDNGVGFDMSYVHKLFGVFQRLHGATEFEGTGVGLALVQRIVQKHGGRVEAQSHADGGATFSFTLPTRATGAPEPPQE